MKIVFRREEASGNKIDDALPSLFDRWHAEAREDDETIDWTEVEQGEGRKTKRTKTSNEGSEEGLLSFEIP